MPGHVRTHEPRRGFTILELVVVLAALSLIASVAIPAYFARPAVTLDNAARLLARDLRETQNRAALYEEPLYLRFAEGGTGYRVTDARGESLVSPYGAGEYRRHYPVDAVFRGVEVVSAEPRDVVFDREGRPRVPVTVRLAYRGEERTLTMTPVSGRIAIEGLARPWRDGPTR